MFAKCVFVTKHGQCKRLCKVGDKCWQHGDSPHTCAICLETVGRCKKFSLNCNHVFHKQCLSRWIHKGNDTCPLCRGELSGYELCLLGVKNSVRKISDNDITNIERISIILNLDITVNELIALIREISLSE